MKGSFVTPIILIVAGGLFLANNLRPEISVWRLLGDYWPYLLIIWGVVRLAEIGLLAGRNQALPRRGVSGGEWALIVVVTLVGSGMMFATDVRDRFRTGRVNIRGMQLFGETFEYVVNATVASPKMPRIIVENRRGNVRLIGADIDRVSVTGHTTVFGMDRVEADRIHGRMKFELAVQGEQVVLRTNHESAGSDNRIESDLEVQIPKGATVECRGDRGDFDVSQINGNFEVTSDNAGVRGQDIGGNVRLELRRSDIVRLVRVKGNVDVKGARAEDLEMDEVAGAVTVNGQFTGDLDFRRLEKTLRFTSNSTEVTAEKVGGRVHLSDGRLDVEDVAGALRVRSKSKDVHVNGFKNTADIDVDRGDIELNPGNGPLNTVSAKTSNGDVTMHLAENAKFELDATTRRGEAHNAYGSPLMSRDEPSGGSIRGGTGGAKITLHTNRGSMTVTRGGTMVSEGEIVAPKPPRPPKAPALVER